MSGLAQRPPVGEYVDLTGFQRDILWTIYHEGGAEYGLGIKDSLEEIGYGHVNHGRLYPNLDTLVENDLVEKNELDKRTNEYALTDSASQLLATRQSWERGEA
ncbi:PadR family transcriptional regulator [haloarchaeon 3A1-DGR]|nr:PadR family transcriptional regulator [haloarchaeon 3A1-DGR]